MKRTICTLILAMFTGMVTLLAQSLNTSEIQFVTLGNCAICKIRIETKLSHTTGIVFAEWDYNTDVTTVQYNNEETDAFQIMHAIADTGHDTEWYPAPDSMYALLIGSCCEYERTIDYTNAQIGYLSLMGLWVYPVGVQEAGQPVSVSIYPSVGTGLVTVDVNDPLSFREAFLTVYSVNGRVAYRGRLFGKSGIRVDLTSLAKGQYLAVVSSGSEIFSTSKLILTH